MTFEEIKRSCAASIEQGDRYVLLRKYLRHPPRHENARIAGPGSPLGRVVGEVDRGWYLLEFVADDLVSWMAKIEALK